MVRRFLPCLPIDVECRIACAHCRLCGASRPQPLPSAQHDEFLRGYLRNKFRDRPIGVLVAQGSSSLEFVLRSRAELWPGVPVVFAAVDEESAARLNLPSDMTGTIYQRPFRNTVTAAQALVPDLKRIALVGDPWERQAVRRHYQRDIPTSLPNSSSST